MISTLRNIGHELRSDIHARKFVPALSAGLTSGLGLLVAQIAFGSFIFSGELAPYSTQGVGLILFGNFAACLLIGLSGGFRGTIAGLSPALVIIMATIAATVDAEEEALFATVTCALIISSVATGLCCFLIGRFHLANLLRFIPYPVAAGFVAGLGATVCLAALSQMGAGPDWQNVSALLDPVVLWVWLPGTMYGVALYIAIKRLGNPLILPASVAIAIGGYNLVLNLLDMSIVEAGTKGLLLASTAQGGLWPAVFPTDLLHADLPAMAGQVPNMLTLMLIAFVCVVMNIAGLELAIDRELDWDREFRATGSASIVAGLGGGTVATIVVPASMRSKLLGATSRLTSVIAALVIGTALFLGGGMLAFIPTALIGGILIFAGLGLLEQGFLGARKGLPRSEFGIILLIFVVIIFFGLIEGVGVGILATLVFFAVRLSRVHPVESWFTVRERRSNKARPVPDRVILQEDGAQALGYRLRGYIFFGSVGPLTELHRESLAGPRPPICLLLDFAAVTGIDFSAMIALARFFRSAGEAGTRVVLSASPGQLTSCLERNLPAVVFTDLVLEPNLDRALEHCEEIIIAAWKTEAAKGDKRRATLLEQASDDLERHLEQQIHFEGLIEELHDWITPCDYAAGQALATADSHNEVLQLLAAGRASARDRTGERLHQLGPGDIVSTNALSGTRVVSVIADEACRTMILPSAARQALEEQKMELAFRLYRYLVTRQIGIGAG